MHEWLGRHQAFALVANRCAAADAECLKAIRDSGDYKELHVTWDEFCVKYAGMTRAYVEQHIQCFEQFGENYRRMAELMFMSPATYRLIHGSVSEKGLELHGEHIALVPANRDKIVAAVKTLRVERRTARNPPTVATLNKSVEKLIDGAMDMAAEPARRAESIDLLERAASRIQSAADFLRQKAA
jgi:hypothetical protein